MTLERPIENTITAVLLAAGGWVVVRYKGEKAIAFSRVPGVSLAMAIGTALFPALLLPLGVKLRVGSYVAWVVSHFA